MRLTLLIQITGDILKTYTSTKTRKDGVSMFLIPFLKLFRFLFYYVKIANLFCGVKDIKVVFI